MSASDGLCARLAERVIDRQGGFIARMILRHLCRYVADTAIEMWGPATTLDEAAGLLGEVLAALKPTSRP